MGMEPEDVGVHDRYQAERGIALYRMIKKELDPLDGSLESRCEFAAHLTAAIIQKS